MILGAALFMIGGFLSIKKANETQSRWAQAIGFSYAIVCIAHGIKFPTKCRECFQ